MKLVQEYNEVYLPKASKENKLSFQARYRLKEVEDYTLEETLAYIPFKNRRKTIIRQKFLERCKQEGIEPRNAMGFTHRYNKTTDVEELVEMCRNDEFYKDSNKGKQKKTYKVTKSAQDRINQMRKQQGIKLN